VPRRHPTIYIYVLFDPRDQTARYVGRSRDVRKRLSTHLSDVRTSNPRRFDWLRELRRQGADAHAARGRKLHDDAGAED
jgi:predicted GIY-YIG superfamily endonuclease